MNLTKIKNLFHENHLKKWQKYVDEINNLEKNFEKLSDFEIKEKFLNLKQRVNQGETLDNVLVECFALVREAAKRTLNQRHYDVQLLGGIGLHKGMVIEMLTGEGKTLVATLAACLNALEGRGVHIITVNDYLAQRDTVWMGPIYQFLGLKVGCLVHEKSFIYNSEKNENIDPSVDSKSSFLVFHEFLKQSSRKDVYLCDIIYGTNHEFGFDYLRDNLTFSKDEVVQKELNYAIIDEVDSILIDEARTPLIIGSYESEDVNSYYFFDQLAKILQKDIDFTLDEKRKSVYLTDNGLNKIEKTLNYNPYEIGDFRTIHHIELALRANYAFHRDIDYVVKNNEVVIVDEFTGRLMYGRRWSGGLHQAIEAKERVPIKAEMKTIATITIQNFFRKYRKLSGMTGTAYTSREEFLKVYGLEVVQIPPNKPCIRKDHPDIVYLKEETKWKAVVEKVKELHQQGRPVLIGTSSIQKNEKLSKLLQEANIPHVVLNAKNHEEEGKIIAQAGKSGMVTVATNMAGRGVDIILGGNPPNLEDREKVLKAGGLFVLGTERHESRRVDNQLRGRAGRQGDPGESQFFVSLEDDLIRIFGGDKIKNIISKFNFPEDQPIQHNLISKAIEEAQAKVEGFHFDIRKHLLEYDNIINAQREKIYFERKQILFDEIEPLQVLKNLVDQLNEKIDLESKRKIFKSDNLNELFNNKVEELINKLKEDGNDKPQKYLNDILKFMLLQWYNILWAEHIHYLEELRDSVSFRSYAHRDPLVEYKEEAYRAFENFHQLLTLNVFQNFLALEIKSKFDQKIGRNEPCPCGSGKKYKKCHGLK